MCKETHKKRKILIADDESVNGMAGYVLYQASGSGDKYLKMFYPFSMEAERYIEKGCLFAAAVVLAACGMYFRCRRR